MGKYFKYAIGEILLVVIGILIALQINNWNETQKLLKKETVILIDLAKAFQNDIDNTIDPFIDDLKRRNEQLDTLIDLVHTKKPLQEHHYECFRALMFSIAFKWEVTAYENLKAEGAGIIQDKDTRDAIIQIYNDSYPETKINSQNFMNNLINYFRPYMRNNFYFDYGQDAGNTVKYYPLNQDFVMNDPVFQNTLVTAKLNFSNILRGALRTKEDVVSTINLINK